MKINIFYLEFLFFLLIFNIIKNNKPPEILIPPKNEDINEIRTSININKQNKESQKNTNDRNSFKLEKVKGDGNCSLRAILKGAKMDENKHTLLREALTNIVRENQFSEEQLQYNGFQSKQDLIDYVSTPGEHLGMEIISLLLEKYNIKIEIWLENQIN